MIPIECPQCGRRGDVPPDRLNSRLQCKSCNAVFQLDTSGHLTQGEPVTEDKAGDTSRTHDAFSLADWSLSRTWKHTPTVAKVGVPLALLLVLAVRFLTPAPSNPPFMVHGEAILRALKANDRDRVMELAAPDTAEAAGAWFDLVRGQIERRDLREDIFTSVLVYSGNADKDSSLVLMGILSAGSDRAVLMAAPMHVRQEDGDWVLDGTKTLADAEQAAATKSEPALP